MFLAQELFTAQIAKNPVQAQVESECYGIIEHFGLDFERSRKSNPMPGEGVMVDMVEVTRYSSNLCRKLTFLTLSHSLRGSFSQSP